MCTLIFLECLYNCVKFVLEDDVLVVSSLIYKHMCSYNKTDLNRSLNNSITSSITIFAESLYRSYFIIFTVICCWPGLLLIDKSLFIQYLSCTMSTNICFDNMRYHFISYIYCNVIFYILNSTCYSFTNIKSVSFLNRALTYHNPIVSYERSIQILFFYNPREYSKMNFHMLKTQYSYLYVIFNKICYTLSNV